MPTKSYSPVYTELKPGNCAQAMELIQTLRNETEANFGHTDPGAVQDCWNSLNEIVGLMAEKIEPAAGKTHAEKIADRVLHLLNTDYPGCRPYIDESDITRWPDTISFAWGGSSLSFVKIRDGK